METEEKTVDEETLKPQEEEVLETSDEKEEEKEDSTDWKAKAEKAEELAKNQKIRAEKAEKLAKSVKTKVEKKQSSTADGDELSPKDMYVLMGAKVPEEDIDKVQEIAKLKGISISEALKLPLTKQILSDENEQRETAAAANVGGSKRSSGQITKEALLANAEKGELPESEEDIQRLWNYQHGK